jgi:vacuolar-type H+-ATPase subunit I/STV1
MDDSTKKFMLNQVMWLGIYFGISIAITTAASMVGLPWPASFGILIAVIIGLSLYRRRRYMRKIGMGQGSFFGGGQGSSKTVEYYCMNCGTKHDKAACPNCGSRMKRVGF